MNFRIRHFVWIRSRLCNIILTLEDFARPFVWLFRFHIVKTVNQCFVWGVFTCCGFYSFIVRSLINFSYINVLEKPNVFPLFLFFFPQSCLILYLYLRLRILQSFTPPSVGLLLYTCIDCRYGAKHMAMRGSLSIQHLLQRDTLVCTV
jgi:hypothetical protein